MLFHSVRLRLTSALLLVLILGGCANAYPSIPEMMARSKWEGRTMEEALAKWGRPSKVVRLKDGQRMAYWTSGYTQPVTMATGQTMQHTGAGLMITDNYVTTNQDYYCRMELTFNDQNIITRFNTWQNRTGGCSDVYWGKNSP